MTRADLFKENEKFNKVFCFNMPVFTVGYQILMFDLMKFDNRLREKYGDYDMEKDVSIHDFVIEKYGKEACEYLESLMQEI